MNKLVYRYIIGIDEVGRGPIAGPVAVGAFVFLTSSGQKLFRGVKESKQLSTQKREAWFSVIRRAKKDGHVDFKVSFQGRSVIDGKGISHAIKTALDASLKALEISPAKAIVVLDGGLKAPLRYSDQKTIIKGDTKVPAIALASICAKVLRDRRMVKLSMKHPHYGFDIHKGYGTKSHYMAIKKYGLSNEHRRSFLRSMR